MMRRGEWWRIILLVTIVYCHCETALAFDGSGEVLPVNPRDSLVSPGRFTHRLGVEFRPEYIFPTHSFLRGEYAEGQPIDRALSAHLKYSFQFLPQSLADRIYGGVYQGIGLSYFSFGDRQQVGNPMALYLFQGARIARFNPRVSLHYEWNFGLSFGWHPHDYDTNSRNVVIGSKLNAYMNTNIYLNWRLSRHIDLTTGLTIAHFSNGNTDIPNAGLNTGGINLGMVYRFNPPVGLGSSWLSLPQIPEFNRHISYDVVLFGSWRRKGVAFGDEMVPSPDTYPVLGLNVTPLYHFNYRFRAGLSLDMVYDGSANVYTDDYIVGTSQPFYTPPIQYQLALGVSARAEYVMPYFTVGAGIGTNVLHGGGDLKSIYQLLTLKIELTRNSFFHIGYTLQDFHDPNFLMLGIGYRFNNKYPTFHR